MIAKIGILALQGDFAEHAHRLRQLGCEVTELRSADDLNESLDALVLPGGESTTQTALLKEFSMLEPIKKMIAEGMPVLATCAGVVLLAREVEQGNRSAQEDSPAVVPGTIATIPLRVRRNAYGRQLASFHAEATFNCQGSNADADLLEQDCSEDSRSSVAAVSDPKIPLTFIRAPQIVSVDKEVDVLTVLDNQPVAVRYGNQLGITFHPELAADNTLYQFFLTLIEDYKRAS